MAYDLIEIRQEHIDGLKRKIEEAPYVFLLKVLKAVGHDASYDDLMGCIDRAIEAGVINKGEPDYLWHSWIVAFFGIEAHLNNYKEFFKDLKECSEKATTNGFLSPEDPDYLLKSVGITILVHKKKSENYTFEEAKEYLNGFLQREPFLYDSFYPLYCQIMFPLKEAMFYIMKNYPLGLSMLLKKQSPDNLENRSRYLRVKLSEAFEFINGMTSFGLRRLLSDICPSYCEDDLVEAIQKGDYEEFKNICRTEKLTLSTELSESVGYIQYNFFIPYERMFNLEEEFSVGENGDPYLNNMLHTSGENAESFNRLLSIAESCEAEIKELNSWVETKEQVMDCAKAFLFIAGMYDYYELLEMDEADVVNKLLDHPRYQGIVKLGQEAYFGNYRRWPKKAKILYNAAEKAQVERVVLGEQATGNINAAGNQEAETKNGSQGTESTANTSQEKTLASRWMTESYHRMTDNVLVELISKKIWPLLIAQVDGLKWTPSKREQPTFPKIKNILAACILFHAMELSGIAKLPKQEDLSYSYDGLLGEKDRGEAGVYTTSNIRAGISSTKKKWNDTLPAGYMAVLGKFLKESELPGRTTSITYLKLLNKWVKKDLEGLFDSADSKVKAKLFVAEAKEDLGPQLYLLSDNKTALRALLREWKEELPPIFNIPI